MKLNLHDSNMVLFSVSCQLIIFTLLYDRHFITIPELRKDPGKPEAINHILYRTKGKFLDLGHETKPK